MKYAVVIVLVALLCSCGSARRESAKSLANAYEAADHISEKSLEEGVRKVAESIKAAIAPALKYLKHDWKGTEEDIQPTVRKSDWDTDPETARDGVVAQAAVANAAVDGHLQGVKMYTGLLMTGIALLFGSGGVRIAQTIFRQKAALKDALAFGKEALAVDPKDPDAVEQVKDRARARAQNTPHAKTLGAAMNDMNLS